MYIDVGAPLSFLMEGVMLNKIIFILALLSFSSVSAQEYQSPQTELQELRFQLAQERAVRIAAENAVNVFAARERARDTAHKEAISGLTILLWERQETINAQARVIQEKDVALVSLTLQFAQLDHILSIYENMVSALEDILIRYCERSEGKYRACAEYRGVLERFPRNQGIEAYEGYVLPE